MKQRRILLMCAVLMVLLLAVCAGAKPLPSTGEMEVCQKDSELFVMDPQGLQDLESRPDADAMKSYLREKMMNCETDIDISSFQIPISEANAFRDFLSAHLPECFHFDSYRYTYSGSLMLSFSPNYVCSKEAYQEEYDQCMQAADRMLQGIRGNDSLTDVEKVLLLHDRLTVACEYDYANYLDGTIPYKSRTMYGALVNGFAVCSGYTSAYGFLLDQIGIENTTCSSELLNHIWNIVYLDGKPYHVDVTWDDPTWDVTGQVYHQNLLVSSETLLATGHHKNGVVDYDVTPVDTTYDNYFWQKSHAEFQLVNGEIYYIDSTAGTLKNMTTDTVVCSVADRWFAYDRYYWSANFTKLSSFDDKLLYSLSDAVYACDPKTGETELIFQPEGTKDGSKDIYGFTYADGYLICDLNLCADGPNFSRDTKALYQVRVPYPAAASVSGTVTSPSTEEITVELCGEGGVVAAVTAQNGAYSIPNVAAGTYTLRFTQSGMTSALCEITVKGADVTQDVTLYRQEDLLTIAHSLDLRGEIGVRYYLALKDGVTNPTMTAWRTETERLENVPGTLTGSEYLFVYNVYAMYISDDLTAQFTVEKDGVRYTLDNHVYSVQTYCENQLRKASASAKSKDLFAKLLNYGAYAQKYFNYRTDDLANANLATLGYPVTLDTSAVSAVQSTEGTDFAGKVKGHFNGNTLLLEEALGIRYYMVADDAVGDVYMAYRTQGTGDWQYVKAELAPNGSEYYATIANIPSYDIKNVYEAYFCEKTGNTYTQITQTKTYGAEVYAYKKLSGTNESLRSCVIALMMYADAASAYFGK